MLDWPPLIGKAASPGASVVVSLCSSPSGSVKPGFQVPAVNVRDFQKSQTSVVSGRT